MMHEGSSLDLNWAIVWALFSIKARTLFGINWAEPNLLPLAKNYLSDSPFGCKQNMN